MFYLQDYNSDLTVSTFSNILIDNYVIYVIISVAEIYSILLKVLLIISLDGCEISA